MICETIDPKTFGKQFQETGVHDGRFYVFLKRIISTHFYLI